MSFPLHARPERDAERARLLSLTATMTSEQNLLVMLLVGTINNLDQQADHQPDHLREHARPRVAGETERALPYNPGRARLILESMQAQAAVGSQHIARYLDALKASRPPLDPAIIASIERLYDATIAETHTLHSQLAAVLPAHQAQTQPAQAPVPSETLFPAETLFPSTGKE